MKKILLLAAAAIGCSAMASAEVPLKIYGHVPDTVYTEQYTVVAVTTPGATAKINGQDVKVYPHTGSFGSAVTLKDGANSIEVSASEGGETATKTLSIFRSAPKPKAEKSEKATSTATPAYVETTDGAYLQYGNGVDRLGGSKIGFLVPGIPMKVLEKDGRLYKVALSENRWAYLPTEYAVPTDQRPSTVNTGSWSVSNVGDRDRVSISLPARLPYRYYTQIDPSTLVVEALWRYRQQQLDRAAHP